MERVWEVLTEIGLEEKDGMKEEERSGLGGK